jgi:hypothetical protein
MLLPDRSGPSFNEGFRNGFLLPGKLLGTFNAGFQVASAILDW